jgi:hypothetical protein
MYGDESPAEAYIRPVVQRCRQNMRMEAWDLRCRTPLAEPLRDSMQVFDWSRLHSSLVWRAYARRCKAGDNVHIWPSSLSEGGGDDPFCVSASDGCTGGGARKNDFELRLPPSNCHEQLHVFAQLPVIRGHLMLMAYAVSYCCDRTLRFSHALFLCLMWMAMDRIQWASHLTLACGMTIWIDAAVWGA